MALTEPVLGIPLPEQPALILTATPIEIRRPAARGASGRGRAGERDAGMVTGAISPSAQPGGLATLEVPPTPAATPGVDDEPVTLDIPAVELPPADPALLPVAQAARPSRVRCARSRRW